MKINENYKVRAIAGENLIVKQGESQADMTRIISLNDSALEMWNALKGRTFELADAAQVLIDIYGIDAERATQDARVWTEALRDCGILE